MRLDWKEEEDDVSRNIFGSGPDFGIGQRSEKRKEEKGRIRKVFLLYPSIKCAEETVTGRRRRRRRRPPLLRTTLYS